MVWAKRQSRSISALVAALALVLGVGCGAKDWLLLNSTRDEADLHRRAEAERISRLEREVERLRTEISEAEQELVAVESGMRGSRSRADAVSALAEARIQVERAAMRAPWRASFLKEAEAKLEEAESLVEAGNFGSAIFFATRAQRIARSTLEEARSAESEPGARSIAAPRVNLRDGPSIDGAVVTVLSAGTPVLPEREDGDWVLVRTADGFVGWVHGSLIR